MAAERRSTDLKSCLLNLDTNFLGKILYCYADYELIEAECEADVRRFEIEKTYADTVLDFLEQSKVSRRRAMAFINRQIESLKPLDTDNPDCIKYLDELVIKLINLRNGCNASGVAVDFEMTAHDAKVMQLASQEGIEVLRSQFSWLDHIPPAIRDLGGLKAFDLYGSSCEVMVSVLFARDEQVLWTLFLGRIPEEVRDQVNDVIQKQFMLQLKKDLAQHQLNQAHQPKWVSNAVVMDYFMTQSLHKWVLQLSTEKPTLSQRTVMKMKATNFVDALLTYLKKLMPSLSEDQLECVKYFIYKFDLIISNKAWCSQTLCDFLQRNLFKKLDFMIKSGAQLQGFLAVDEAKSIVSQYCVDTVNTYKYQKYLNNFFGSFSDHMLHFFSDVASFRLFMDRFTSGVPLFGRSTYVSPVKASEETAEQTAQEHLEYAHQLFKSPETDRTALAKYYAVNPGAAIQLLLQESYFDPRSPVCSPVKARHLDIRKRRSPTAIRKLLSAAPSRRHRSRRALYAADDNL